MDSSNTLRNLTDGQGHDALDGAADNGSGSDGVSLADLEPLTTLLVHTANTVYRIVVMRGTTVLVKGGKSFPEITTGDLLSFGVNVLRCGWIGVGLRMEIHSGRRCVVTSPVRGFTIERRPSADRVQ